MLRFRRPATIPLLRMSELQRSFVPGGTVVAFSTSRPPAKPTDVGDGMLVPLGWNRCCKSDIRDQLSPAGCRFCSARSVAAKPLLQIRHPSEPPRANPAFAAVFGIQPPTNPQAATVFWPRSQQTRQSQQFSAPKRAQKCCKQRVCEIARQKSAESCGFAVARLIKGVANSGFASRGPHGCRKCNVRLSQMEPLLRFRHPEAVPLLRMSEMQRSFVSAGTVAANPTSINLLEHRTCKKLIRNGRMQDAWGFRTSSSVSRR